MERGARKAWGRRFWRRRRKRRRRGRRLLSNDVDLLLGRTKRRFFCKEEMGRLRLSQGWILLSYSVVHTNMCIICWAKKCVTKTFTYLFFFLTKFLPCSYLLLFPDAATAEHFFLFSDFPSSLSELMLLVSKCLPFLQRNFWNFYCDTHKKNFQHSEPPPKKVVSPSTSQDIISTAFDGGAGEETAKKNHFFPSLPLTQSCQLPYFTA